ncbi:uncharacterized protein UBRO_07595 [Ustilago bromivora]|uniref:GH26 domain-containing protein n=1 Tax=Ustilago bromivora TaxID=307758 RepID=A0A1K0GAP4_9BASI|nr:uncharacterized protein UBRO_07595 [Ustilago bromivora]SYW77707.1 uncharacterized protein UBRO2_01899 [Ustilago bromivora]
MSVLSVNCISIGFYPDEGDSGGTKSYLSHLNTALSTSWPPITPRPCPIITTVGWYAQTYPNETFTGSQLLPLVDDLKCSYTLSHVPFIYEASVMPFQSWAGYTPSNNTKAREIAHAISTLIDRSRISCTEYAISEVRLRFGHEMNYYISSGLYPPPTDASNPGLDYGTAFDQVALACRSLPSPYKERIKMFWCPNIASTSTDALQEYQTYLPSLEYVDYVGIDYYCPAPGCLDSGDFVKKMRILHDKYCSEWRPFILGETGLHYDEREAGGIEAKLKWLQVVTGKEVKRELRWMRGVSWFNYEKDRDYRLIWVRPEEKGCNDPFMGWVERRMDSEHTSKEDRDGARGKVKKFLKTLIAN